MMNLTILGATGSIGRNTLDVVRQHRMHIQVTALDRRITADDVALIGESRIYRTAAGGLEWHFCPTCGCIAAWRAGYLEDDGRRRMAVNLRLAEDQDIIRPVPLARFDGLNDLGTLPRDGRTVGDVLI